MLLSDWLEQDRVTIIEHADSWEEAVRIASRPLLRDGAIKQSYVEEMLRCIKNEGPFVVIAPLIALPHVRYEEGVLETSSAFLKLHRPVNFGEENEELPVQLIVVLATTEDNTHLKLLSRIVRVFEKQEVVDALLEVRTIHDVHGVAEKYTDALEKEHKKEG